MGNHGSHLGKVQAICASLIGIRANSGYLDWLLLANYDDTDSRADQDSEFGLWINPFGQWSKARQANAMPILHRLGAALFFKWSQ